MQSNSIDNRQSCKAGFSLKHKAVLLLILPVALQIGLGWELCRLLGALSGGANGAYDAREVSDLSREAMRAGDSNAVAIMDAIESGDSIDSEWLTDLGDVSKQCRSLENMLQGDDVGAPRAAAAVRIIDRIVSIAGFANVQMKHGKFKSSDRVQIYQQLASLGPSLKVVLEPERLRQERLVRMYLNQQTRLREEANDLVFFGAAASILLLFLIAVCFQEQIVRRMETLMESGVLIAGGRPPRRRLSGSDELARLDASLQVLAESLAQSQLHERALIDNCNDVICSIDRKGAFVNVSKGAARVFGYDPLELISSRLTKLVVPEDQNMLWAKLKNIAEGGIESPFEAGIVGKDGKVVDVLFTATWSEQQANIFCVARDVSAERNAERLRQEVLQMASHDLRTPMVKVQAFLDAVDAGMIGNLDHRSQKQLLSSCRDLDRMLTLINDLVDVERAEAGALELVKSFLPLSSIFERSVEAVSSVAMMKEVTIEVAPVDLAVYVDQRRIEQIMVNLLTNAIKFAPQQSVVAVRTRPVPGFVEVRVSDSGAAIPERLKEKIFDRFQQVRELDSREERGGGLGLTMCRVLIELHGGNISIEPGGETGSTFLFRIPFDSASASLGKAPPEVAKQV